MQSVEITNLLRLLFCSHFYSLGMINTLFVNVCVIQQTELLVDIWRGSNVTNFYFDGSFHYALTIA